MADYKDVVIIDWLPGQHRALNYSLLYYYHSDKCRSIF